MFFRRFYSRTGGLATNRIEAFSDGVFGVAITLLVLAIAVPQLGAQDLAAGKLLHALAALAPKVLIYVISFGVIGIFWVGHHIMFAYIERSDRTLLWLNMMLLMSVSFIPFAADLLGQYSREPVALAVYGGTLAWAGLMFEAVWLYASGKHRLIRSSMPVRLVRRGTLIIALTPVVYGIAALLAFRSASVSLLMYVLVPILYVIPGPIDELVSAARDE